MYSRQGIRFCQTENVTRFPRVYLSMRMLFWLLAAVPLAAQTDTMKMLKAVEKRYNTPRTMQMEFEQSLTGQGLGRIESGTLYLQKPGKMRWTYRVPENKFFLSDGTYTWFYSPNTGVVERSKVKESDDMRAPLAFLVGKLDFQRDFKQFTSKPVGADTYIVAVPKSEKAPYSQVEFQVTPEARIGLLKVIGQDRSVLSYRLTNEKVNPPVDAGMFRFTMPAGAKLMDEPAEK